MPPMAENTRQAQDSSAIQADIPDRLCTWCKVTMRKRRVGGGQFIHYTCPKCVFQHTTRWESKPPMK
jgi:hypothetical protein